jgi:hypothetical protein
VYAAGGRRLEDVECALDVAANVLFGRVLLLGMDGGDVHEGVNALAQ